jgi:hypothetical protein
MLVKTRIRLGSGTLLWAQNSHYPVSGNKELWMGRTMPPKYCYCRFHKQGHLSRWRTVEEDGMPEV